MRKHYLIIVLLLSLAFVSFNVKNNSSNPLGSTSVSKINNFNCGPSFDSLYNQHSTVLVSTLSCNDPFGNNIPLTSPIEPGDHISISASGSLCGYAGGNYHYFFNISNPNSSGSIQILDQSNNVITCQNITTKHLYHLVFNATCATTYKIVISNSSC